MSLWEEFVLKQENKKTLKLDDLQEPTEKDYIYLMCYSQFGGVCSEEEIREITDIVHKAYLRKEE